MFSYAHIFKRKHSTFLCILVAALIFSSCAIHKKFPFICFKKECVLGQLGFYAAKDFSLKAKANIKANKNKRKRSRNRQRMVRETDGSGADSRKKDSLNFSYKGGRSSGICLETKLIFTQINSATDTIVLYYNDFSKDISELKKKELKEYVEKHGATSITEILIKNCHDRNVLTEHEIIWLDERASKIKRYLKKLDVPTSVVKTEE